jgi:hypothetical protein
MSAENSPMTRDSIELSLCHYWEILVGQCTFRPAAASALGFRPASGVPQGDSSERSGNLDRPEPRTPAA